MPKPSGWYEDVDKALWKIAKTQAKIAEVLKDIKKLLEERYQED